MIKSIYIKRNGYLLIMVLLFSEFQPGPKLIILHDEPLTVAPKEFYVANVVDDRDNRAAVAWVLPADGKESKQAKTYPVDFQGGGLLAIKRFIDHNLPKNTALRPIVIRLKKFVATESPLPEGLVEGDIEFTISIELQRGDDDMLHLGNYSGSASYKRNAGPPQDIEPKLRHVLVNGLIDLTTWMDHRASTDIKLAKEVKISFGDYEEKKEGDTIYYSVKRPLTWDDFKSKIPDSKYDAETFPGFGYEEHAEVVNGVVNVRLNMKVYLPKSASWVKNGSRNDYSLNHEQRHFDIVKIVSERFKSKLRSENLSVSNFEGPINVEYLESYREMDALQKQYDNETKHGTDQMAQHRWNERIDKELKSFGVK